jgi:uracil phosphoribosyltransferase
VFYADRIIRLLLEHALNHIPLVPRTVVTRLGSKFHGLTYQEKICGVSIVRAGEAFEHGLRQIARSVRIGKILIQKRESGEARLISVRLPPDVASRWVLLLDPMLATGDTAKIAVQVLSQAGVPLGRILFVSMFSCPEGIQALLGAFPHIKLVTGVIDRGLTADKFIIPGLGDFGDLYFGTGEDERESSFADSDIGNPENTLHNASQWAVEAEADSENHQIC